MTPSLETITEMNNTEVVVCIHGLFMNGWDMTLLRSRISDVGYDTHQFSYSSTSSNIELIVEELRIFVEELDAETVHFVCHSLGGLIVRHYLEHYPSTTQGRIVTLGTPHNGSGTAHFFHKFNLATMLLGESLNAGLLGNAPEWKGQRELGSLAGNLGFGIGSLFKDLDSPNDGTVSVNETVLENSSAHLQLSVSHTGLVLSKEVADEVLYFLKEGRFSKN